jgi:hypothetical protein
LETHFDPLPNARRHFGEQQLKNKPLALQINE